MKKYIAIIFTVFIICNLLASCSNSEINNVSETIIPSDNETLEYTYLETLGAKIQDYKNLTEKYKGNKIEYSIKNTETDEILNISDIDGIKIIELYSGYCTVCVESASFVNELTNANKENFTYIMISKEKNSNEIKIMRDAGITESLYYFPDEIPLEAAKLFDIGRPGYMIINEENELVMVTGGNLNINTYETIFSVIENINDPYEDTIKPKEENPNDKYFCGTC